MGSKIKPRHGEDRSPKKKKLVGLRAEHDRRLVPLRIREEESDRSSFHMCYDVEEGF